MKIKINIVNQEIDITGVPVLIFKATDDHIEIVLDEEKIAKQYSERMREYVATSPTDIKFRKPMTPSEVVSYNDAQLKALRGEK